jgi:predicted nucleic acid-binding protein
VTDYLLDTNVVSEWVRPRPDPHVVDWLATVDEDRVFLSVITLAELRRGVQRLDRGRRRQQLADWLSEALPARFDGRLVQVDARIADRWGRLMAEAEENGRPLGAMDGLFAATADAMGLTLVTRNEKDLDGRGVRILNPWTP